MSIIKPPVLPAWADGGDKVQPINSEISTGWPNSSIPPSRQRFNWILNFLANAVRYFSRRGMVDYDALETYQTDDIVRGDNGLLYRSLTDSNIGNAPSTSPTKWGCVNAVTPSLSDKSTSVATTKYTSDYLDSVIASAFAKSLTTNGYQKLPSGLIIQWGAGNSGGLIDFNVTLPIAFPNGIFQTFANDSGFLISGNAVHAINWRSDAFTTAPITQVRFVSQVDISNFTWVAIGY